MNARCEVVVYVAAQTQLGSAVVYVCCKVVFAFAFYNPLLHVGVVSLTSSLCVHDVSAAVRLFGTMI